MRPPRRRLVATSSTPPPRFHTAWVGSDQASIGKECRVRLPAHPGSRHSVSCKHQPCSDWTHPEVTDLGTRYLKASPNRCRVNDSVQTKAWRRRRARRLTKHRED